MICLKAITAYLCKSRPGTWISWLLISCYSHYVQLPSLWVIPHCRTEFTLSSKSNSNGLYFNSPIITKLDQKFKSNCFFYYSRNFGSITINVLLTALYKMSLPRIFFDSLSCLWTSIFNVIWCLKSEAGESFTNPSLLDNFRFLM
jgi:hypothetical protein